MNVEDYMLPCLSKKYIGIDCFGCGMQRAIAFLLRGEFEAAFYMYPGIYPLLITLGFITFNYFKPIKHAYAITVALITITVTFIVTSYFIKLFT